MGILLKHILRRRINLSILSCTRTLTKSHTLLTYTREVLRHQNTGIYALSSGFGKCGVSVIRISGEGTQSAMLKLGKKSRLPKDRSAVVWNLYHPRTKVQLDKGLVFWFRGPESFTGEDVCELHVHGGPAVVAATLDALAALPGLRPAEAGEFTKRAFQNGKLDLTEVEGLGDLIHAETEAQRRQALQQMQGALSTLYGRWRKTLVKCVANAEAYIDFSEDDNIEDGCVANAEAYIDFSEDDNIEDGVLDQVQSEVHKLQNELARHLADKRRGERLRTGVSVAIVGEPNVGKSSLLNAITQRETAIVSSIAGTTRDVIERAVDIGGYPVLISDTAGLRESVDVIEREGVQRALQRAAEADMRILVLDAKDIAPAAKHHSFNLQAYISQHLSELGLDRSGSAQGIEKSSLVLESGNFDRNIYGSDDDESFSNSNNDNLLIVVNKSDLVTDIQSITELTHPKKLEYSQIDSTLISSQNDTVSSSSCLTGSGSINDKQSQDWSLCLISCTTGDGLDIFLASLTERLKDLCSNTDVGNPSLTQARHRAHLNKCLEHLQNYDDYRDSDIVLATEELRQALRQLGKVTGKVTSEEILDVVFRDFCIGK